MDLHNSSEETLVILAEAWSVRPHLRLGQLIYNAIRNGPQLINLYDYEDRDLVDCLVAYCGLEMTSQEATSHDEAVER